jgi:hypothetical protein
VQIHGVVRKVGTERDRLNPTRPPSITTSNKESAALFGSSIPFYFQPSCFIPAKLWLPESRTGTSLNASRRRCTTPTTTTLCSLLYPTLSRLLLAPWQDSDDENSNPTPKTSSYGLPSPTPWRGGSRGPCYFRLDALSGYQNALGN